MVAKLTPKPATGASALASGPSVRPLSGVVSSARPRSGTAELPVGLSATKVLLGRGGCSGQGPLARAAGHGHALARERRDGVAAGERVDLTQLPAAGLLL